MSNLKIKGTRLICDFLFLYSAIVILIIVYKIGSVIFKFYQIAFTQDEILITPGIPLIIWISLFFPVLVFLYFSFRKKIYKVVVHLIKGLKYRYRKCAGSSKEDPCDFSIERPIISSIEDRFGFKHLAKRVFIAIKNLKLSETRIFAITGKHGIGKSSLINLVHELLRKENEFVIILFNPWYYKDETSLNLGFINEIKKALREKVGFEVPNTYLRKWEQSITLTLGIKPSVKFIMKPKCTLSIENAKKDIGNWLCEKGLKLAIFLDDLGRCDKNEIKYTLKLLRYFADFKNSFFLIGYDKDRILDQLDEDIEKFVEQEIPLDIEKALLYGWFRGRTEKCELLRSEFAKFSQDGYANYYFREFFSDCLNTPRKIKLFLNDLLMALPIVKDKVYFPHFVLLAIVKRDMPKLYNLLSSGWYWTLQVEEMKKGTKKIIQQKSEFISKIRELYEDEEEIKRAYVYLRVLGSDINFSKLRLENVEEPEIKPPLEEMILISKGRKYIWDKGFTEVYFHWKEPSFVYTDGDFANLITKLKGKRKKDAKRIFVTEIESLDNEQKIINLVDRLYAGFHELQRKGIDFAILEAISSMQKMDKYLKKATEMVIMVLFFYPKRKRHRILGRLIRNSENPLFLHGLYLQAKIKTKASWFEEGKVEQLKAQVTSQFDKILSKPGKCFCEFEIPIDRLGIFTTWGDAKQVANYLSNLRKNKSHRDHAKFMISEIMELSKQDAFFSDVADCIH